MHHNHNVQFSRYMVESLRDSMKLQFFTGTSVNLQPIHYSLLPITSKNGGPKWTRFAAAKPRRLQQSTGLLPRAAFRVHFGSLGLTLFSPLRFCLVLQVLQKLVGQNGLEPSTSRLSVVCSSQLSYWPILVEISGIEPLTSCLQGRRSPS